MRGTTGLFLSFWLACGAAAGQSAFRSEDPGIPLRIAGEGKVAPPRGLPAELAPEWRQRLSAAPAGPPVVDARGRVVVVTTSGQVTQWSPDGHLLWQRDVAGEVADGPVLGADGTRYVVTRTAVLVGWDAIGRQTLDRELSSAGSPATRPRTLPDGTIVIAIGKDVLRLESDGRRRSLVELPGAVHDVIAGTDGIVMTLASGDVYYGRGAETPRRVGSLLGRPVGSGVRVGDLLVSRIDAGEVVSVNLETQARRSVYAQPQTGLTTLGRRLLLASGEGVARVVTLGGTIEREVTLWSSATPGRPPRDLTMELLAVSDVAALAVVPDRGVGRIGRDEASWTTPAPCPSPRWAATTRDGRVAVACADGILAMLAQAPEITRKN